MSKNWKSMKIKFVGQVRDVVLLGGGKLSMVGGDPGEPRKPSGIEGN